MTDASTKQMGYLRKLYYNSDLLTYKSYDTFDDIHRHYISQDDAQILINRKQIDPKLENKLFRQEVQEIINKIEEQI